MSSTGINAINSGPLILRVDPSSINNNTYVLGRFDNPIPSNFVLITSTNGVLVPTDSPSISTITVSSINGLAYPPGGGGGGTNYWTLNGSTISNNNVNGNVAIGSQNFITSTILYIKPIYPSFQEAVKIELEGSNVNIFKSSISGTSSDTIINNTGGDRLVLGTDNPTLFINGSNQGNNNVGIGTTTPQYQLDINGNTNIVGTLFLSTNAGGALRFTSDNYISYIQSGLSLAGGSANKLYFTTIDGGPNVPFMIDMVNNRVGVNNTSPDFDLSVVNKLQVHAGLNDTVDNGMVTFIRTASTGYVSQFSSIHTIDYIVTSDTSAGAILGPWVDTRYVYNPYDSNTYGNSVVWEINMSTTASGIGQNLGDIKFLNNVYAQNNLSCSSLINVSSINGAVYTNYWTLNGNNLYNNSGTNIGIGTTTPHRALQVGNVDYTTTSFYGTTTDNVSTIIYGPSIYPCTSINPLALNDNFASGLFVATTDASQANVGGGITLGGRQLFNTSLTAFARIAGVAAAQPNGIGGEFTIETLKQTSTNTAALIERMRITVDGNVGIGTSTPDFDLSVINKLQIKAGINDTLGDGMATFIRTASTNSGIYTTDYTVVSDGTGFNNIPYQDARYIYNPTMPTQQCWGINMSTTASGIGKNMGDIKFFQDVYAQNNLSCSSLINVSSINGTAYPPSGNLPIGGIIMWSGTSVNLPGGYNLCDGGTYNGVLTPDLRGRFVMGTTYATGTTIYSGQSTAPNGTDANGQTLPSYATGTTGGEINHPLTVQEMPGHSHTFTALINRDGNFDSGGGVNMGASQPTINANTNITGGAGSTPSGGGTSGNGVPHNNQPQYYVLAFIMRTL